MSEEKYYCEHCGIEISKEEYEQNEHLCNACYEDLQTEDFF